MVIQQRKMTQAQHYRDACLLRTPERLLDMEDRWGGGGKTYLPAQRRVQANTPVGLWLWYDDHPSFCVMWNGEYAAKWFLSFTLTFLVNHRIDILIRLKTSSLPVDSSTPTLSRRLPYRQFVATTCGQIFRYPLNCSSNAPGQMSNVSSNIFGYLFDYGS